MVVTPGPTVGETRFFRLTLVPSSSSLNHRRNIFLLYCFGYVSMLVLASSSFGCRRAGIFHTRIWPFKIDASSLPSSDDGRAHAYYVSYIHTYEYAGWPNLANRKNPTISVPVPMTEGDEPLRKLSLWYRPVAAPPSL